MEAFCQIDENLQRIYRHANHYTIALKFKSTVMYTGTALKKYNDKQSSFLKHQTLLRHMTFDTNDIITLKSSISITDRRKTLYRSQSNMHDNKTYQKDQRP